MATTTNYSWTTPDDTDLVKDGAAAIRTLGTSIDTTTKALNPSTTLGDIEYRSSTANTNTRLGIGSTGDVLTVAGGVPSWAAPGAAGANWSLLNAGGTSLTGNSVTVSGISGADKIFIEIREASSANAASYMTIRLNGDTASNYRQFGAQQEFTTTYSAANYDGINFLDTSFGLATTSSNAGSSISGYLQLSGCNSSGVKVMNLVGAASDSAGNGQYALFMGGYYSSASTISSVNIRSSSGNFDNGTIFIYTSA